MNSDPTIVRVFVAIPLPDGVRAGLREIQAELRKSVSPNLLAWTRPENMHLTLRFLGGVDSARLPELQSRLCEALAGFGPVELICERLGCFPDVRFPRVLWAWVHDAAERLGQLHHRVDAAVSGFAEKPAEPRFVGHVTLARPKQIKRADAERLAQFVEGAVTRQFGSWRADSVALIRSELSGAGAKYQELFAVSLL